MMIKGRISKILVFLVFINPILSFAARGQGVRDITVSYDKSYTDHISLAQDSRDMDLIVKFVFDEQANTLTVSLISYRSLFVFREDTRYGNVIRRNRLDPEELPYIASFPPKSRFQLSKTFRKSIPKPHKNYIFKRWIDYRGLQPVPTKYRMVNDYIEQTFEVTNYGNNVWISLGYVVLMDKTPTKKHPDDFTFVAGKNLGLQYNIHIERNPCFGKEEETEIAENTLAAVSQAFVNFKALYSSGIVENETALKSFRSIKSALEKQFPSKNSDSPCPAIKSLWDSYDCYVDSISSINCDVRKATAEDTEGRYAIDAALVNSMSRQIDRNVSRWLASNDVIEKRDLVEACEDIISEIKSMYGNGNGTTPEQRKAMTVFRQAEAYFRSTCITPKSGIVKR